MENSKVDGRYEIHRSQYKFEYLKCLEMRL